MKITIFKDRVRRSLRKKSLSDRIEIAEEIAARARVRAPRLTGAYAEGMGVAVEGTKVSVVNEDPTAWHKEYGTSKTPAHAVLTNAAMEFGRYQGMRPKRGR